METGRKLDSCADGWLEYSSVTCVSRWSCREKPQQRKFCGGWNAGRRSQMMRSKQNATVSHRRGPLGGSGEAQRSLKTKHQQQKWLCTDTKYDVKKGVISTRKCGNDLWCSRISDHRNDPHTAYAQSGEMKTNSTQWSELECVILYKSAASRGLGLGLEWPHHPLLRTHRFPDIWQHWEAPTTAMLAQRENKREIVKNILPR